MYTKDQEHRDHVMERIEEFFIKSSTVSDETTIIISALLCVYEELKDHRENVDVV